MKVPKGFIEQEGVRENNGTLVGQQLEYIYVNKVAGFIPEKRKNTTSRIPVYECNCKCGNTFLTRAKDVKNNKVKSCGCYHKITSQKLGLKNKKEKGSSGLNSLYRRYITNAKRRNIDFNLTIEEFKEIINKNCYYCNLEPHLSKLSITGNSTNGQFFHNGIDRKDGNKDYTIDNIVTCCKKCNYSKHISNEQEFISQIERIYLNLKQKGLV